MGKFFDETLRDPLSSATLVPVATHYNNVSWVHCGREREHAKRFVGRNPFLFTPASSSSQVERCKIMAVQNGQMCRDECSKSGECVAYHVGGDNGPCVLHAAG